MKKQLLFLLAMGITCASAQEMMPNHTETQSVIPSAAEAAPQTGKPRKIGEPKALWDIQLSANLSTNAGAGMAGVAYLSNTIIVSKWASDTIVLFDQTGAFQSTLTIAGLSGTRAITTDGTYVYAANNTGTIYRVNPITLSLAPPHIASSVASVRYATYDPTLDGGSGGFWVGNFNTDLSAISMSGTLLTSIPAATHGLAGMYGVAVDNVSSGGPYLWVSHQEGTNQSQITAVEIATGNATIFTHDAFPDIQTPHNLTTSLAGGAFFATDFVTGENTLMVLEQGDPNNVLVAYEIDAVGSATDVAVTAVVPTHGYTKIPDSQVFAETWEVEYYNGSTGPVDTIYVDMDYYFNGNLQSSETVYVTSVPSAAIGTLTGSAMPFANGIGAYMVEATVRTSMEVSDGNAVNDVGSYTVEVTPDLFSRDDEVHNGGTGYAVSSTDWAYAASMFELSESAAVTGIEVVLATPVDGDTTYAMIFAHNGTLPTTTVATGDVTIIDVNQNTYELMFPAPVFLNPGTYAFGCYEGANTTINLAQSSALFTPGTNYFYTGSSGVWAASGIQTARFIHPIIEETLPTGVKEEGALSVSVYPNPTEGEVYVRLSEEVTTDAMLTVIDMSGREVMSQSAALGTSSQRLDVSQLEAGIYLLSFTSADKRGTARFMVR